MVGLGNEGLWMTPFTFDFLYVTVDVKSGSSCAVFPLLLSLGIKLTSISRSEGMLPAHLVTCVWSL